MNNYELQRLKAATSYPSITITLPTHRTSPENQQDPIRVKNLVTEATNRLLGAMTRREAEPLLTRLDALAADINYPYLLDGTALFVSADVSDWHTAAHTLCFGRRRNLRRQLGVRAGKGATVGFSIGDTGLGFVTLQNADHADHGIAAVHQLRQRRRIVHVGVKQPGIGNHTQMLATLAPAGG